MRPSLWFITPVHGRLPLAAICLRQLRRTCDALIDHGIDASAVIIADRDNLHELRRRLGRPMFNTVEQSNDFLSKKYNDGIQLACDRRHNQRPVDYVVPCGSDDWIDYRILLDLPPTANSVVGFQRISFVREDGREMTSRLVDNTGGVGIRIYPRQVFAHLGFRPADEDRGRACDTSILTNVQRTHRHLRVVHREIDPRQIVDWKTDGQQLNTYEVLRKFRPLGNGDPFVELADVFPHESLTEMAAHYARTADRQLVSA